MKNLGITHLEAGLSVRDLLLLGGDGGVKVTGRHILQLGDLCSNITKQSVSIP